MATMRSTVDRPPHYDHVTIALLAGVSGTYAF
jgi:hypothetical protein